MTQREFTDSELRAYLAGDAADALREAIDAALESDDDLGRRIAALDDFSADLAAPFDALLNHAPMSDLEARLEAAAQSVRVAAPGGLPQRRFALMGLAASLAVGFGLGLVTGRGGPAPGPAPKAPEAPTPPSGGPAPRPAWLEAVAGYVRLFSDATFQAAPLTPTQRAQSLAALSRAVELDLAPLATVEGLALQRAEVLQLRGRPLGQIAYLDAQGAPVAVCVLFRPRQTNGAAGAPPTALAFKSDQVDDLNIVHWDEQPYGFLVIGRQNDAELRALAQRVAALV